MGAQLRVYRRRIRSVQATKKITKAMELIASSRIVKAQQASDAALPYATALIRSIGLAAAHTPNINHPLLATEATVEGEKRAGILLITADRGLAGAYSSNAIKAAERLAENLNERGVEPVTYIVGRKGESYYRFRERPVEESWTGFSDDPTYDDARRIADVIIGDFLKPDTEGGIDEIHVVYTHFINRVKQDVRVRRVLPLRVVNVPVGESTDPITGGDDHGGHAALPLYDFEPGVEAVLDDLLPRFGTHLVYTGLLLSAASEHAARQRAMSSATDNAEDLIKTLTRQANQARQAEITQEISEIVGGADALASANAGS
jgi:F-type H+-transporting ATPase subunit gamma